MKAFTIWQPWASLVMIGAKPYEFRPKSFLDYIGHPEPGERIVVHAGARPVRPQEVADLVQRLCSCDDATGLAYEPAIELLERVRAAYKCRLLPLGAGLGTAVIGKPVSSATIYGRTDSDRGEFNWAWPLGDIVRFEQPIEARGYQGFWHWSGS